MKTTLLLIAFALSSLSHAVESPERCKWLTERANMEDEVEGLTLGNTHEVYKGEGRLLRGHEPKAKVQELANVGVTDVVIYKVQVKNEVAKEVEDLRKLGLPDDHVHVIEMPWNGIKDPVDPCKKTIAAVNYLLAVARTPGRSAYFHCSAGQDRTGLLAGVLRMVSQGWSAERAFFSEMCGHGYGFGDSTRPARVSSTVETNLTPIFLQIASHIAAKGFSVASTLDPGLCTAKPKSRLDEAGFKCK